MFGNSLNTRLLIFVSLVLALFFTVTIIVLDVMFRDLSERAIRDRLDIQVLALIAVSDERSGGLAPAVTSLDSRYLGPNSGLYGEIAGADGAAFWLSPSLLGTSVRFPSGLRPGSSRFNSLVLGNGTRVLALSQAYRWEFDNGHVEDVVFSVAESMEPFYAQLANFRRQMFSWFGALSLALIGAMAVLFRRVLKPLRMIEREIEDIEAGRALDLAGHYPRELMGAAENMNALLRRERERMVRYRNTLGNLAHSLKTPLAVMRNVVASQSLQDSPAGRDLNEQVRRMDDIVRYQLKRAAASAGTSMGAVPVPLIDVIGPLDDTLHKVYFERRVHSVIDVPAHCSFLGDRNDLMEIIGNLLDNAFKYCRQEVRLTATPLAVPDSRHDGVLLIVEDDGPGIAPDKRQHVLKRGARLDERQDGQGIGLSVVNELAELYQGDVHIDEAPLGGARITVRLIGA